MDVTKVGPFKKYAVIVLWVALSGALTSLIEYVSSLSFDVPVYVAILAIINYILKAALTWVTTKK
jgi:hypothetical protein